MQNNLFFSLTLNISLLVLMATILTEVRPLRMILKRQDRSVSSQLVLGAIFGVLSISCTYTGLEEEFGYTVDESEKGDLTTEAERLSYEWVKKHYNHEFLFITDYSAEKRAFYHMRDENGVPQGYDLIWRGVEITTGAQREHRYEVLKKQAEEKGLAEDVKFYLEFFQYGCPPHGGFGLGIDRLTMLLCGLSIKDAEFLFRGPNRLTP